MEFNFCTLDFWSDLFKSESFVIFELQTQHRGFTVENHNFILLTSAFNKYVASKKKKACLVWDQQKRKYIYYPWDMSYYWGGWKNVWTPIWDF